MTLKASQSPGKRNMEKSNEFKVVLSSKFYDKDAISESISEFAELADAVIERKGEDFLITLSAKSDAAHIDLEFCNYVLSLMKNKSLV